VVAECHVADYDGSARDVNAFAKLRRFSKERIKLIDQHV
jgi:hypothetical protein